MTAGQPGPHRGGRRRGAVRAGLAGWARQWASEGRAGGQTLPELAGLLGMSAASRSERTILEQTVSAMVRAGELIRLGLVRRPGQVGKPLRVYAPAPGSSSGGAAESLSMLADVAMGWGRGLPQEQAGRDLPALVQVGAVARVLGVGLQGQGGNLLSVVSTARDESARKAILADQAVDGGAVESGRIGPKLGQNE